MLQIDDLLENKYRIIGYLGHGGWSRVHLAENIKLGNRWAIKEIDLVKDHRVNLLAEPDILKQLDHRSLPRIIDVITIGNFLYIIEDYFEGTNLKEIIKNREICTEENAIDWGLQLCEILIYLHNLKPRPIIYRDMKPGNIIIDQENNVRLIDFGIAREYRAGEDSDSTFIGTRGYAAPEQYSVDGQSDERTDIYGLGATLYHVLTGLHPGGPPYTFLSLRVANKTLSASLEKIITKCLQPDPNLRYQKASDLMKELGKVRDGRGTQDDFLSRIGGLLFTGAPREKVVEKILGTITIAVGGTTRASGCTHLALSLASFLTRYGLKVAVIEINETPVFYTLKDDNSPKGKAEGSFVRDAVDFYCQRTPLGDLLGYGYDYVVLDLGSLLKIDEKETVHKTPQYDEMNRANLAILVAGSAIWQMKDLTPYLKELNKGRWLLALKTPAVNVVTELKKEINCTVYGTTCSPDPFQANSEQDKIFSEMLKGVLPKGVSDKKKKFFWK